MPLTQLWMLLCFWDCSGVRKWPRSCPLFCGKAALARSGVRIQGSHLIHTPGWAEDIKWLPLSSSVPLWGNRREIRTVPALQLDATIIFQFHYNLILSHDETDMPTNHWLPCTVASYQANRREKQSLRVKLVLGSGFTLTDPHVSVAMLLESTGLSWKEQLCSLNKYGAAATGRHGLFLKGSFYWVAIKTIFLLKQTWDKM